MEVISREFSSSPLYGMPTEQILKRKLTDDVCSSKKRTCIGISISQSGMKLPALTEYEPELTNNDENTKVLAELYNNNASIHIQNNIQLRPKSYHTNINAFTIRQHQVLQSVRTNQQPYVLQQDNMKDFSEPYGSIRPDEDVRSDTITQKRAGKVTYTMGYRADCEKCKAKVRGHYSHFVYSTEP
ncbi:hypothetical protein V1512DRAFT_260892 [Lipomyces arxii]|uniref:uncharacterized protein n=1 Tax=Lipomyces arxii TaxID=56418 RepID=UPI0034CE152C